MTGKRLLDLAALVNASRGVAQKHVALRARQLDVYNQTSTLAAAVRHQTARVTETAKAAAFLASRLNESAPSWTSEDVGEKPGPNGRPGPEAPSPAQEQAVEEVEVRQEEEAEIPLPDGTIPLKESKLDATTTKHTKERLSPGDARRIQRQAESQIPSKTADAIGSADPFVVGHDEDCFYKRSGHTSPTLSSLPRVKIPKHSSDIQEGQPGQINSDSYYKATNKDGEHIPSVQAVPEQEQVPGGINTDIFRSPQVSKLLISKSQKRQSSELELNAIRETPIDHTNVSQGRDQDTFSVLHTSQKEPSPPTADIKAPVKEEIIEDLAQEISQEANKVCTRFRLCSDALRANWKSLLMANSDIAE